MMAVKEIASVIHGIPPSDVTRAQAAGLGRSLAAVGIPTTRISNITYVDTRHTSCAGVLRHLQKLQGEKKTGRKRSLPLTEPETEPAVNQSPWPEWKGLPLLSGLQGQPAPATNPADEAADEAEVVTIPQLLRTIERMAEELAEKDIIIASLRAQLGSANHKLLNETVRRAIAHYGEVD